jgi:hypothetical protein
VTSHPIVNDAETSVSVCKLVVSTVVESRVFSYTSLSQSE